MTLQLSYQTYAILPTTIPPINILTITYSISTSYISITIYYHQLTPNKQPQLIHSPIVKAY